MSFSFSNADILKIFKDVYHQGHDRILSEVHDGLVDSIKVERIVGANQHVPIDLSMPTGIADTISNARLNESQGTYDRWEIRNLAQKFRVFTAEYEGTMRSKEQIGAYVDGKLRAQRAGLRQFKTALSHAIWRGKSGCLGQLKANAAPWTGVTDETFTLVDAEDARNFHIGQILEAHTVKSGAGGAFRGNHSSGDKFKVKAVDVRNGYVTLGIHTGGGWTTTQRVNDGIALGAAGDFLYQRNTRDTFANGLPELLPMSSANPALSDATVATTLYGVDRWKDPQRLAGFRVPFQSSFYETITETLRTIDVNSDDDPRMVYWMNTKAFAALIAEAEHLSMSVAKDSDYSRMLGTRAVQLVTPQGMVRVATSRNAPSDRMYLLDMSALKILALDGKIIDLIDEDGNTSVRNPNQDSFEMVYRSYMQNVITEPQRCAVNNLPAYT